MPVTGESAPEFGSDIGGVIQLALKSSVVTPLHNPIIPEDTFMSSVLGNLTNVAKSTLPHIPLILRALTA